jgi:Tol biopolymer transport system component
MTKPDFEQFLRAGFRATVDEFASSALRATVNAIPDVVSDQRRVLNGWRFPRMARFAPLVLAATAIVVILIGIGLLVRGPDVGPPTVPTATPKPTATSEPTAPIGAIAYVTESGLSSLHLVLPDQEPLQLAPSSTIGNDVVCPSFSPDGTMLAVGMPAGSIIVVPIDDQGRAGDGSRLDTPVGETPHCAAWAPDNSAVAFLDDSALVIVPLAGEPQRIEGWDTASSGGASFLIDYPPDRAVQWSPDGSVIAVARPSGTWLIPTDGGVPRRLHETPAFSVSWSPDGTRLVVGAGGPQAVVIQAEPRPTGMTLAVLPTGYGPPVWSPVEDRIAFSDGDAGLVVVRPDGSDPIVIDDYGYHPTWSSDGRQLIYLQDADSAAWRLMLADATGSGEPTMIVDSVAISSARSFPAAEQITWQPLER